MLVLRVWNRVGLVENVLHNFFVSKQRVRILVITNADRGLLPISEGNRYYNLPTTPNDDMSVLT